MDTVKFTCRGRVSDDMLSKLEQEKYSKFEDAKTGWRFTPKVGQSFDDKILSFQHLKSGLRVSHKKVNELTVEASLPRVLFGSNSYCILDQEVLQNAIAKLQELLRQIVSVDGYKCKSLMRIDYAFQIYTEDATQFLQAYCNCRTPLIRNEPESYHVNRDRKKGNGIQLKGKDITITMYDKGIEMNDRSPRRIRMPEGKIIRIEVSFKTMYAVQSFDLSCRTTECTIPTCNAVWSKVRDILGTMHHPKVETSGKFNTAQLLAFLDGKGIVLPTGQRLSQYHQQSLRPDTGRKYRAEAAKITPALVGFALHEHLPRIRPRIVNLNHLTGEIESPEDAAPMTSSDGEFSPPFRYKQSEITEMNKNERLPGYFKNEFKISPRCLLRRQNPPSIDSL